MRPVWIARMTAGRYTRHALRPAGRATTGELSEWLKEHDWKSCVPA